MQKALTLITKYRRKLCHVNFFAEKLFAWKIKVKFTIFALILMIKQRVLGGCKCNFYNAL